MLRRPPRTIIKSLTEGIKFSDVCWWFMLWKEAIVNPRRSQTQKGGGEKGSHAIGLLSHFFSMVIFSFPHLSAVHIPTFCGIPSHTPPPDSDPCFVGACGFAERIWYRSGNPLPGTLVISTIRGANFVNPAERRHPLIFLWGEIFLVS